MKTYKLNNEITLSEKQMKDISKAYNEPESEYPIFKIGKTTGLIVKFTSINYGTVVFSGEGKLDIDYNSGEWVTHENEYVWKDLAYNKKEDLWDGQPVYCWTNDLKFSMHIRFYDAINKCVFTTRGTRECNVFDNYEALPTVRYDKWITEALETLER